MNISCTYLYHKTFGPYQCLLVLKYILLLLSPGRMLHSTGKETKGRGGRGDLRRTIVLSFLAGCKEEELSILLDLVIDPFTLLLKPGKLFKIVTFEMSWHFIAFPDTCN